ncbi:RICIN domain-containing protein [Streptomyces virginiae]|uniref:RICIN domain-containing protein n=1 Tax=Streptomyces virginiae TaxID=1961 RepID=UPI00363B74B6
MKLLAAVAAALVLPLAAAPAVGASNGASTTRAIVQGSGYLNIHQCSYVVNAQRFTNFMPNTLQPEFNAGTNTSQAADTQLSCGPGRNGWRLDVDNSGFQAFDLKGARYLNLHQCVYRNAGNETVTSVLPNVASTALRAATNVSGTIDAQLSCGPGNTGGYSLDAGKSSVKTYDLRAGKFLNLHQCGYVRNPSSQTYTNLQPNTAEAAFNTGTNVSDSQDTAPTCGGGGNGWTPARDYSVTLAMPIPRPWMCFDVGSAAPAHRDPVTIRECEDQDSQRLVVEDGQIKVQSTLATTAPKCLDMRSRTAGQQAHIWTCAAPATNANQQFRIQSGQIKVADTLATAAPMCLDFGTAFNNGDPVALQPCAADGSQNPGQDTTVQSGFIIAHATM